MKCLLTGLMTCTFLPESPSVFYHIPHQGYSQVFQISRDSFMKLLLTSVFKPFAVDDEFGRKENIMELFHNQVTREQGVFSFRYNHVSMGLYLLAENISVPTIVLDFPSQKRFIREIKKGYEYIGISFIVPNFVKAKRMAELVRHYSPDSKIILGGHGTSIENIERLIDCDYVCHGEGIRFLRELFNNDVEAPIKHPILYSAINKKLMGIPMRRNSAVIMPGVGCVNACRFCTTSHFFDKKYTPFLKTGQDVFDVCLKTEEKLGVTEFFIMDENFLKSEQRVHELVQLMEKHEKAYTFGIFSSAETVRKIGLDLLEKMGISFLWLGVESKREVYEKNKGINFQDLVRNLRNRGIVVLASGILFLEHHTKETIHEDIDFMTSLNADFVQFMQLGPLPGTKLYKDYESKGLILHDVPYEEWHGQDKIWFKHPHFTRKESASYLKDAFIKDFRRNGPSILRFVDTQIRGTLSTRDYSTSYMKKRHEQRKAAAWEVYPLLDALSIYSPTKNARKLARDVRTTYKSFFGKRTLLNRFFSFLIHPMLFLEQLRCELIYNNRRKVKTLKTTFRMSFFQLADAQFKGLFKNHKLKIQLTPDQIPIALTMSGILDSKNVRKLQAKLTAMFEEVKNFEGKITLDLSDVQVFDEEALRRFLQKIEKYYNQFKLEYSISKENSARAFEKLVEEFNRITFVPVENPQV